jgi:hypothetical protein
MDLILFLLTSITANKQNGFIPKCIIFYSHLTEACLSIIAGLEARVAVAAETTQCVVAPTVLTYARDGATLVYVCKTHSGMMTVQSCFHLREIMPIVRPC